MTDSKQVLVVADSDDTILFLSELLEEQNHRFQVARNDRQAQAAMRENRPDLVLLEIMMARRAGHGVFREMKTNPTLQRIPIIIIFESIETRSAPIWTRSTEGPSPDDFIEKPIDPPTVVEKINGLLANAPSAGRRIFSCDSSPGLSLHR